MYSVLDIDLDYFNQLPEPGLCVSRRDSRTPESPVTLHDENSTMKMFNRVASNPTIVSEETGLFNLENYEEKEKRI